MLPAHPPSATVLQEGADDGDPPQPPSELTWRSQAIASQLRVSLGALPFIPSQLPSPEEELLLQKEHPGSLWQGLDRHHPQQPLHIGTPAARALENHKISLRPFQKEDIHKEFLWFCFSGFTWGELDSRGAPVEAPVPPYVGSSNCHVKSPLCSHNFQHNCLTQQLFSTALPRHTAAQHKKAKTSLLLGKSYLSRLPPQITHRQEPTKSDPPRLRVTTAAFKQGRVVYVETRGACIRFVPNVSKVPFRSALKCRI